MIDKYKTNNNYNNSCIEYLLNHLMYFWSIFYHQNDITLNNFFAALFIHIINMAIYLWYKMTSG